VKMQSIAQYYQDPAHSRSAINKQTGTLDLEADGRVTAPVKKPETFTARGEASPATRANPTRVASSRQAPPRDKLIADSPPTLKPLSTGKNPAPIHTAESVTPAGSLKRSQNSLELIAKVPASVPKACTLPGDITAPDWYCNTCFKAFPQASLEVVDEWKDKPFFGDAFFEFTCAKCAPTGVESVLRQGLLWFEIVHLALFWLTSNFEPDRIDEGILAICAHFSREGVL
jgi:hypothetical protein